MARSDPPGILRRWLVEGDRSGDAYPYGPTPRARAPRVVPGGVRNGHRSAFARLHVAGGVRLGTRASVRPVVDLRRARRRPPPGARRARDGGLGLRAGGPLR